jgi:hypothetical protein
MRNLLFKFAVAVVTFLVGLGFVGLVLLLKLDWTTKQAMPAGVPELIVEAHNNYACDFRPDGKTDITRDQAIQIAECFVIENGFTDLPPDPKKAVPDWDSSRADEFVLKARHNTLERHPYAYRHDPDSAFGAWFFVFRRTSSLAEENRSKIARFMTIDSWGNVYVWDELNSIPDNVNVLPTR